MLITEEDENFISIRYHFKDKKCHPPIDTTIAFNKQNMDGEIMYGLTIFGKVDNKSIRQIDMDISEKS